MDHPEQTVVQQMAAYLRDVIEQPHPAFGGLPICPFARKARLAGRISYQIYAFGTTAVAEDATLLRMIEDFCQSGQLDLMLVIHPIYDALTLQQVQAFTAALNHHLAERQLIVFDGHPLDEFQIQGVYTRQAPLIHLTVQTHQSVQQAADLLRRTAYYDSWSPAQLAYVGLPHR